MSYNTSYLGLRPVAAISLPEISGSVWNELIVHEECETPIVCRKNDFKNNSWSQSGRYSTITFHGLCV